MRYEPFDYQLNGIDGLRNGFKKGSAGLLVMLPGAGKTITALTLMRLCSEKGNRCLFLCDRRMLADQAVGVALEQGLDAGLLMAGRAANHDASCQFASKQSLESWIKKGIIDLPEFHLIVVDEAHRAVSESFMALVKRWPNAFRVGLTATPVLGNGNGLGAYYDFLVQPILPSELLARGRTVPVRAFAPHVPDMAGVKTGKDGDWKSKDLSERLTRENLIGDVYGWWKKLGEDRPSVYFGCDVSHAISIRDEFRANGVTAEIICDETPDDERKDLRRRSENGEVKVVVNVDVMAEGIDWPWVSCIGLVRPTKRLRRYIQCAGRGMRSAPGKKDMILIDHAGCVLYHGMPDVDHSWPLDPEDNIDKAIRKEPPETRMMRCAKCTAMFKGSRTCPECGHVHTPPPKKAKDYAQSNGTLVEVSRSEVDEETLTILCQRFWGTCIGTAIKRNRHAGAAAGMFSHKFGIPPWQAKVTPLPPERGDWQRPARDVFPGFVRGQKHSRGDAAE